MHGRVPSKLIGIAVLIVVVIGGLLVFTAHAISAQCIPSINQSCESPQAAAAKRERIRNDMHTNIDDPDFQNYCAATLSTYRPKRGFGPFVLHEYRPFNGVRMLYTNGWRRVSTGRLYFKTLLALLENDNIHYQLLVVNCFIPRSMTAFARIKLNPEHHGEGVNVKGDTLYELIIGDGVVIDIAGNIDVINHDALFSERPET